MENKKHDKEIGIQGKILCEMIARCSVLNFVGRRAKECEFRKKVNELSWTDMRASGTSYEKDSLFGEFSDFPPMLIRVGMIEMLLNFIANRHQAQESVL